MSDARIEGKAAQSWLRLDEGTAFGAAPCDPGSSGAAPSVGESVPAVSVPAHCLHDSALRELVEQVVRAGRAEPDALRDVGGP